jgi:hypothetical protein
MWSHILAVGRWYNKYTMGRELGDLLQPFPILSASGEVAKTNPWLGNPRGSTSPDRSKSDSKATKWKVWDSELRCVCNCKTLVHIRDTGFKCTIRNLTNNRTNSIKVKVKLSLCLTKHHDMKTYWGSGGIAPRILDLGTRWMWVVSFTPQPLYRQGKSPWYLLYRRLVGPQNHSGHGGEEKNSQPPPGIEP